MAEDKPSSERTGALLRSVAQTGGLSPKQIAEMKKLNLDPKNEEDRSHFLAIEKAKSLTVGASSLDKGIAQHEVAITGEYTPPKTPKHDTQLSHEG